MGLFYTLVNLTKKERIGFGKLAVAKKREIAGNPAAAAMVAWYLLDHIGDQIGFVADELELAFDGVSMDEIKGFPDRTHELIEELIEQKILADCGILYRDDEDPEIYSRDIRNCWMPADLK